MAGGTKDVDEGGSGVWELLGVAGVVDGLVRNPPPTAPNLRSVVPKFLLSTGVDSFSFDNAPAENKKIVDQYIT